MTSASDGSFDSPRPELERLDEYVGGMLRAWDHEIPTLHALANAGGLPRVFLQEAVQEHFWRAVTYAEGIHQTLDRNLGIAAIPLIRILYETHLTLIFLSTQEVDQRAIEAQAFFLHRPLHTLWNLDTDKEEGRELDIDGKEKAKAEEALARLSADMRPSALELARSRARHPSWTGRTVRELADEYGQSDEHRAFYGYLSPLTHGDYQPISRFVMRWEPKVYEDLARNTHLRLRDIRRRMQDTLNLRFADDAINSFIPGDSLLVKLPHANIFAPRP